MGVVIDTNGVEGPCYAIDYNYQGANSIALVTIPEPTTMGLAMGVMSLGLLSRRRRRIA